MLLYVGNIVDFLRPFTPLKCYASSPLSSSFKSTSLEAASHVKSAKFALPDSETVEYKGEISVKAPKLGCKEDLTENEEVISKVVPMLHIIILGSEQLYERTISRRESATTLVCFSLTLSYLVD